MTLPWVPNEVMKAANAGQYKYLKIYTTGPTFKHYCKPSLPDTHGCYTESYNLGDTYTTHNLGEVVKRVQDHSLYDCFIEVERDINDEQIFVLNVREPFNEETMMEKMVIYEEELKQWNAEKAIFDDLQNRYKMYCDEVATESKIKQYHELKEELSQKGLIS